MPRLIVLFWKVKRTTHTNSRELKCGYVGIVIVLFVLAATVGVTMGGVFVI